MIIYDYWQRNHAYREHLDMPVQQALQRALLDIDRCIACPLLLSNEQGIEIYSQQTIFRIYIQPFLCEMRQVQQQTRQAALLRVSVPNIGR